MAATPAHVGQYSDPGGVAPMAPAGAVTDTSTGIHYVADSGGNRILSFDSAWGNSTVVSSAGWNRPRGIAMDPAGHLWVADTTDNQIVEISTSGAQLAVYGGTTSFTKAPFGIAADSTGVYVADTYNYRVFKINAAGAVLWTTAGSLCGNTVSRPRGLAIVPTGVSGANELYVADTDHSRIVVLNPATGACIRAFGGPGKAAGQFSAPRGVEWDGTLGPTGGVWVAEAQAPRLQHLSSTGTSLGMVGSYGTGPGKFNAPACVFADGAYIDVCDTYAYDIQRFTTPATGTPAFVTPIIGGVLPTAGGFDQPFGVAYAPNGDLFVSDMFNQRMQRRTAGSWLTQGSWSTWGGFGTRKGSFQFPRGVAVSADGLRVIVTNSENNRIDIFDATTFALLKTIRPAGTAFNWPHQTALAADGTYWVADTMKNRVLHLSATGAVLMTITNGGTMRTPRGVAVDGGFVFVSDSGNNQVLKFNASTGALVATLATNGTGPTQVRLPWNITVAGAPTQRLLYVADGTNGRVVVMDESGNPVCTFGTSGSGAAQLSDPRSVAVWPMDAAPQQVVVADFGNDRLSLWSPC